MKISIITPTYNSEKTISENISSVLSQSYKNYEHIIVDNCSNDSTIAIAKALYLKNKCYEKLIIISEKDEGIADAFNKGLRNATGDIITILNSDDKYYSNNVFKRVIDELTNDNILFVHGDILFVDNLFGTNIRKPLLCDIRTAMPFNHPTMFIKRKLFDVIGEFDKNYKYAMDYEFVCRIYKKYDVKKISKYLTGEPLVEMKAGGISWQNEIETIRDTKTALKVHLFWNVHAKWQYCLRICRTRMKLILSKLGLNYVIKLWRNFKWKT